MHSIDSLSAVRAHACQYDSQCPAAKDRDGALEQRICGGSDIMDFTGLRQHKPAVDSQHEVSIRRRDVNRARAPLENLWSL